MITKEQGLLVAILLTLCMIYVYVNAMLKMRLVEFEPMFIDFENMRRAKAEFATFRQEVSDGISAHYYDPKGDSLTRFILPPLDDGCSGARQWLR